MEQKPPDAHTGPGYQPPPLDETSQPRRSKHVRLLVWIVILLGFAVLFWVILTQKSTPAVKRGGRRAGLGNAVTVTTATVSQGNLGVYLDAIGTVTPVYTDTITSQAQGLITEVHYREGQVVQKGQALIDIDPRPYEAQLLEAQGTLERDQNLLAEAQMDLKRYQTAAATAAISKQILEDQEKLVAQDEGTVKIDQGTVQSAQVQLSYCHIVAPVAGRVGLRLVDPGNVVTANSATPLVVVTQLQPITVVFTVAEDSIAEVEQQLRHGATLEVDAYDRNNTQKIATGKVQVIDNQIDTTTGTVKLRAVFSNKDNSLFPNQFVNARLLVKMLKGVNMIASSTIQYDGPTAYVYLIQDGTAHVHDIKAGITDGGNTQVLDGLNVGDVAANSSFEKLQDGSKIELFQGKEPLPTSGNMESGAP
jgi:multidrug efflux system membrane fusion protein